MPELSSQPRRNVDVPEGLWIRCQQCAAMVYRRILEEELHVCPECNYHYRIGARTRIQQLNDPGTFEEFLPNLESTDPLKFQDRITYKQRLAEVKRKTGDSEAIVVGKGFIKGRPVIMGVMNSNFIMASMGAVVGEKVVAATERAIEEELPLVMITCSGGARMMEGMVSLAQMAKTSDRKSVV
jgi:acetyl-CoA carboxylase carboxyl transferase subunit beta